MAEARIEHPNREKAESKATRSAVALLMVTSAVLVLIITLGGLSVLQGMLPLSAAYVVILLIMAYFVMQWNRGVLAVAAGMAILLTVFAAIAAPGWFARDKDGFDVPALEPSILGLLTVILIPVSVLLIVFSLRGFQQQWNVEVEVHDDDRDPYDDQGYQGQPSPA